MLRRDEGGNKVIRNFGGRFPQKEVIRNFGQRNFLRPPPKKIGTKYPPVESPIISRVLFAEFILFTML